jgi:ion channel-forming bestrophin family protein
MVVEKPSWFSLATQINGSVLPEVLPRILLCSGVGFLISCCQYFGLSIPEQVFGSVTSNVAYNLVLGLLVVFRTNTAYDRYWEGRKSWGTIVINALNLGRKIKLGVTEIKPEDSENKANALKLLGAFAIAAKLHLRNQKANDELMVLLNQSQFQKIQEEENMPLEISLWIGQYLKQQQLENRLSIDEMLVMNGEVDKMVESFIGCDRIKTTPVPLAYTIYLKRLLLIYCFILPFQLVHDLGWWTAPIVALISFILLGIEEIGEQIEDPFGNDANDLDINQICSKLLKNLKNLISS